MGEDLPHGIFDRRATRAAREPLATPLLPSAVADLSDPLLGPCLGHRLDGSAEDLAQFPRQHDHALAAIGVARSRYRQMREDQHRVARAAAEAVPEQIAERLER